MRSRITACAIALLAAGSARSEDRSLHVPPTAPAKIAADSSHREMVQMMQMDDTARIGMVALDRFEWRGARGADAGAWEAHAWYGGDYDKVWVETEGERMHGRTHAGRAELLWDRILARWWSRQLGARQDFGSGPPRTWAAVGIKGLAPQWFDVEATLYLGDGGRSAARLQVQYELLWTQRLILQPRLEANLYGKADPQRGLGAGVSDLELGLRLRYEIRREFAPYLGVSWSRAFGRTADSRRAGGEDIGDTRVVAGVRVWL
ncbi:MAG: copper resistance protein B [Steroidobacteraceae bacterium]